MILTKEEFFQAICANCKTEEEKIVCILRARGFLIDQDEKGYFLSDNAAYEDLEYLAEGMAYFGLGYIEGARIDTKSSGREKLIDKTAYIRINEHATVIDSINFFQEAEQVSFEEGSEERTWLEFLFRQCGRKVQVKYLESYIALYVKALSACGCDTYYSCDGNHKNGGKIFAWIKYPYSVWGEILWNEIIPKELTGIGNLTRGIKFTKENQYDVYYWVYQIADYLYKNRKEIRNIKKEVDSSFSRRFRREHMKKQLEETYKVRAYEIIRKRKPDECISES